MNFILNLNESDLRTIHFIAGRYEWSRSLMMLDEGVNALSLDEAFEIAAAIEDDMEGGHGAFPMLERFSGLAEKLTDLYKSVRATV